MVCGKKRAMEDRQCGLGKDKQSRRLGHRQCCRVPARVPGFVRLVAGGVFRNTVWSPPHTSCSFRAIHCEPISAPFIFMLNHRPELPGLKCCPRHACSPLCVAAQTLLQVYSAMLHANRSQPHHDPTRSAPRYSCCAPFGRCHQRPTVPWRILRWAIRLPFSLPLNPVV